MVLWKALTMAGTVPGCRQRPRQERGSTAMHREQSCRHIPGSSQPRHPNESTWWPGASHGDDLCPWAAGLSKKGRDPQPGYLAPRQLASVQGAQKQLPWPGRTRDIYHGKCKPPFTSSWAPTQRPSVRSSWTVLGQRHSPQEHPLGQGGIARGRWDCARSWLSCVPAVPGLQAREHLAHGAALPLLGGCFLPRRPSHGAWHLCCHLGRSRSCPAHPASRRAAQEDADAPASLLAGEQTLPGSPLEQPAVCRRAPAAGPC